MLKIWEVAILLAVLMNGISIWSLSNYSRDMWLRVQILEAREVMGRRAASAASPSYAQPCNPGTSDGEVRGSACRTDGTDADR